MPEFFDGHWDFFYSRLKYMPERPYKKSPPKRISMRRKVYGINVTEHPPIEHPPEKAEHAAPRHVLNQWQATAISELLILGKIK